MTTVDIRDVEALKKLTKEEILDLNLIEAIAREHDEIIQRSALLAVGDLARKYKVYQQWNRDYKRYENAVLAEARAAVESTPLLPMALPGQPVELLMPRGYNVDAVKGVMKRRIVDGVEQPVTVCPHPIIISARLRDVESKIQKIEIAWYRDKVWQTQIVDRTMIASRGEIVELTKLGVQVTSGTAPELVDYLLELETVNSDTIPVKRSSDHFGWVNDGKGGYFYVPYAEDIVVSVPMGYEYLVDPVHSHGDYDVWKQLVLDMMSFDKNAGGDPEFVRFGLAVTFSAPLVKFVSLPFTVNLWGTSSLGKSVLQQLCASVFADPAVIPSFDSTDVGLERVASLYGSMPCIVEEFMLSKDSDSDNSKIPYKLANGRGRVRGTKNGGLDKIPVWHTSFLTSSERPLTTDNSYGGAIARVIEICTRHVVFCDKDRVLDVVTKNYGHAGEVYTDWLIENIVGPDGLGIDYLKDMHRKYVDMILSMSSDINSKQAMAAGCVALGGTMMVMALFGASEPEAIKFGTGVAKWVTQYLATIDDVNPAGRAYDVITGWVAAHMDNIQRYDSLSAPGNNTYGKLSRDEKIVYVIKPVLDEVLKNAKMNPKAVFNALVSKGLALTFKRPGTTDKEQPYKKERVAGTLVYVYGIKLEQEEGAERMNKSAGG